MVFHWERIAGWRTGCDRSPGSCSPKIGDWVIGFDLPATSDPAKNPDWMIEHVQRVDFDQRMTFG